MTAKYYYGGIVRFWPIQRGGEGGGGGGEGHGPPYLLLPLLLPLPTTTPTPPLTYYYPYSSPYLLLPLLLPLPTTTPTPPLTYYYPYSSPYLLLPLLLPLPTTTPTPPLTYYYPYSSPYLLLSLLLPLPTTYIPLLLPLPTIPLVHGDEFTDTLLPEYETYLHGYCSQVELTQIIHFNLHNTVIKEEMGDTPFAVISREAERVNVLNTEYNIDYVLNNMYHPWLSYLWL